VDIHREDAESLGIQSGEWVHIASRRGEAMVRAAVGETVAKGTVFMPMHYAETNFLTCPAFDPVSREPSYKYAAVSLHPAEHGRPAGAGP
jgi:anaerobic selenocysteine-containing dehydrogenase